MNRKNKVLLCSTAMLLMATVLLGMGITPASATSWHDLTDSQRNQLILSAAQAQVNSCVGLSCKVWAQRLVNDVSSGSTQLPLNDNNPGTYYLAQWLYGYYTPIVIQSTGWIYNYRWYIQSGNIIQMRHSAGGVQPHTMIVEYVTSWGITVIDCNWSGTGYVIRHTISYSWFLTYTQAWTVYQIK